VGTIVTWPALPGSLHQQEARLVVAPVLEIPRQALELVQLGGSLPCDGGPQPEWLARAGVDKKDLHEKSGRGTRHRSVRRKRSRFG